AHHALRAEVWEKALNYSRQAGEMALGRSANREAWTHLERAIAVLPHLTQTRATREQAIDLRLAVRTCLAPLGEYARVLELGLEAEPLAHALNDPRREVLVYCAVSIALSHVGRCAEAVDPGQCALAIAESLRDPMLRIAARHSVGIAYWLLGAYRTAIDFFQRDVGLELDQITARLLEPWEAGLFEQGFSRLAYLWTHATAAICCAELGEFDEAMLQAERALKFAQALDSLYLRAAGVGLGSVYVRKGDLQQALNLALGLQQTYAATDLPMPQLLVPAILGEVFNLSGRIDEAVTLFEETWQFAKAKGMLAHGMQVLALLGDAYGRAGRIDEAITTGQQAVDLAHRLGHRGNEARALYLLGNIHGYGANATSARDSYQRALTLAQELSMRPLLAQCHLALGELAGKASNRPHAQQHLTVAAEMFRKMGMQFWLRKAEASFQTV
ncbi:MAG TPA: tetratricopeptide repeat protein, partial [Burkholderiales bacterium]|nr:tetratricopeptide repeat protein [Burkholderiales bacterium]